MSDATATQEYKATLEHWQKLAELQIQFVETLGQYKVETAKAELMAAVSAGEWAVARMKANLAHELDVSLRRLARQRSLTTRRVERLARQARQVTKIRSGEDLSATQLTAMWSAFTVFERMAPAKAVAKLLDTPLQASAKQGSSYADPHERLRDCPDPPESVDNVHALLGWLKQNRLVARRGTAAYLHVLEAMSSLTEAADAEVQKLTAALQQLEQGTYNTWQPVAIVALPDSVDAKKIIRLGTK